MPALSRIWKAMPRWCRAAAVGLAQRLTKPQGSHQAILVALLAFALLWTLSATIRNWGVTLHGDMLEEYAVSGWPELGASKHPPLINWITAAWFSAMPVRPWSFYLLSCLNAALGLWAVWLAAGQLVEPRRRVIAVALLGLLPAFTFQAATFNHNTLQLSLWPLVALTFLLSAQREHPAWAVLFGATSALALLGKYYAAWIVLACAMAALVHPARQRYFLSHEGYLKSPPIVFGTLRYFAACIAYLSPALLMIWLCLRPAIRFRGEVAPMQRVVAAIAWVPVVLPALVFPVAGFPARVPWVYPAFFFAPLAIVAYSATVGRRAVAVIVGTAAAVAALAVVLSPLLMVIHFRTANPERGGPHEALAHVVTQAWRERTGRPLRLVAGAQFEASALSFYSPDHPAVSFLPTRAPAAEQLRQWNERGVAGVCLKDDADCNSGSSARCRARNAST